MDDLIKRMTSRLTSSSNSCEDYILTNIIYKYNFSFQRKPTQVNADFILSQLLSAAPFNYGEASYRSTYSKVATKVNSDLKLTREQMIAFTNKCKSSLIRFLDHQTVSGGQYKVIVEAEFNKAGNKYLHIILESASSNPENFRLPHNHLMAQLIRYDYNGNRQSVRFDKLESNTFL